MPVDRSRSPQESAIANGWTFDDDARAHTEALAADNDAVSGDAAGGDVAGQQLSAAALVAYGLIGGVYLLYTMVWFSWANAAASANAVVAESSGTLGGVLQRIVFWCAPGAPALWCACVVTLCRGARLRTTLVWLLLGAVVLLPLPMFGGAR